MLEQPRVSVIVPALNEAATIAICLARVLEQPFVAEVIVVDDGSTDDTASIVRQMVDPRVRVISHPVNRGKGASIRTAVPACSFSYIAIQDADLEYDPADLGRLLEPLDSGEALHNDQLREDLEPPAGSVLHQPRGHTWGSCRVRSLARREHHGHCPAPQGDGRH